MSIKAVVFDYGKVISFPPAPWVIEKLAAIAGLDPKTMDKLMWSNRSEYDRGTLNGREYYHLVLSKGGRVLDDEAIEDLLYIDTESWTNINPGTIALMEGVKAAGLKLGILSNMPHDFLAMARDRFPIFKACDAGIFSCEISSNKPEPAIYKKLIAALGCEAREIAFFDDLPANVEGAKALGISAFVWQDPKTAQKELHNLGLTILL
jgi:putative hydrolase of the HAD superfamily